MKPTGYFLFLVSLVLAATAALLYLTPNPSASGSDGMHGEPGRSSALLIALIAAAGGAAALGWALLRFGGKGYTETHSPLRR
jgi:hypothetical protein